MMERSLINAIAYAKRNTNKGYSFGELIEDAQIQYHLRDDETEILKSKLETYCKENYIRLVGM